MNSSNSVVHKEERSKNEDNCCPLDSASNRRITEMHRYALVGIHLERYRNGGDAYLQRIVALDETCA
ncbi:hypothetical protein TNCT_485541 [Trichonephila clavata]|uniref:Uncharacterized protein n=1 Tax=Trichonephila clavata TaxID=2740835 RepID=A0A8X6LVN1_TRICU|nr:hypothetical protein TNCT_485541 [Trichonephila clavata]